jgi:signal transduction histidine kinase
LTHRDEEFLQEGVQLTILKDIAEALNETTDVSQAMEAILPRLSGVLGLSTAWAFRFDPKRSTFVEVGASGLPPALSCNDAAPLKTGWCECQDQFVSGRLDKAVNIVRCSRLRDAVGDKAGLKYHASVPLRSKGKPLGILNVAAAGHNVFTNSALQLLTAIGHHVAVAVDRAGILADERHRANQLKAMSEMAAELVSFVQPTAILEYAVRQFVDALGYECCGITVSTATGKPEEKPRLVAAAYKPPNERGSEYSYLNSDDQPLLPEPERVLLPDARSVLVRRIPHSEYEIRLESCYPTAFRDVDEDVVSAFAWHVAAALENARLYQQSLEDAKWVERRRLAADLHDAVSQRLFSALLLSRTVKMLAERKRDYSEIDEAVVRIERLIAESQQEMRDLIETLCPQDERGLVSLIRQKIAPLQLQTQTRIHLTVEGDGDVFVTFEQREALLKVVDEALQNAFKHAQAKNVYLRVSHSSGKLMVSIQDDGIGFRESSVQPGLGTSTMYERVQRIGGTLYITSRLNEGTCVTCEVPLLAGQHRMETADDREEVDSE